MKRMFALVVTAVALVASPTPSHATTNGPFEWLNTVVAGYEAKPVTNTGCIIESWGGAYNNCSSTVTVEVTPAITFPAGGVYARSSYLAFYPVSTVSLSCMATYIVNPSSTNIGTGLSYWTSGWTTANHLSIWAPSIPSAPILVCQIPPGQTLRSVYITGTNTP